MNTDATDFGGWAAELGPRLIRFGYLLSGDALWAKKASASSR